jgi:hypothetical protein
LVPVSTHGFWSRHTHKLASGKQERAHRKVNQHRRHGDDGDTLIEILVTIVIVGLTFAAVIGAFAVAAQSSVEHRQLATNDIIAKNFAEFATNAIELTTTSPAFVPCATFTGSTATQILYGGTPLNYVIPNSTYTVEATNIQYLSNTGASVSQVACLASSDPYLPEMLQVTVVGPKGSQSTLSFIVTDPSKLESNYWPPSTTTTTTTSTTTTTVPTSTTTSPSSTTTTVPQTIQVSAMTGAPIGTIHAWYALVTVNVEDQNGQAISGVVVTGTWSPPISTFSNSCTTDSTGSCQLVDGNPQSLSSNTNNVTFTVTGLSLVNYAYVASADNPNPPTVTVSKP